MNVLTCPKCQGQMRRYERGGVDVDQCAECRGVFLDRGELERLVDAESRWAGGMPPTQGYPDHDEGRYEQPWYDQRHHHDDDDDDDDDHRHRHHKSHPYKKKKRKSFFEELFDD